MYSQNTFDFKLRGNNDLLGKYTQGTSVSPSTLITLKDLSRADWYPVCFINRSEGGAQRMIRVACDDQDVGTETRA